MSLQAVRSFFEVCEELDLLRELEGVGVVRRCFSYHDAVEDEYGPDEGVVADIESAGPASVRWRLSLVDVEDSCDVAAVPVIHDPHHPEGPLVGGRELEDCEAVPGDVMTVLNEVVNGFSDRDLCWGCGLS